MYFVDTAVIRKNWIYSFLSRWILTATITLEREVFADEALVLWNGRLLSSIGLSFHIWYENICVGRGIIGLHMELYNSKLYTGDDTLIDEGNKY